MQKLVVASGNLNKIKEIKEILGDRYNIVSMQDVDCFVEVDETGTTFEENAFLKAQAVYQKCKLPVIADDSGLIVDVLGDEPGVFSARYAGLPCDDAKNNEKLLAKLKNEKNRQARFVTCIVFFDGKNKIVGNGEADGIIIDEYRGANGFGYDPIFFSRELNKTFGESSSAEKNRVSHRARALRDLMGKML